MGIYAMINYNSLTFKHVRFILVLVLGNILTLVSMSLTIYATLSSVFVSALKHECLQWYNNGGGGGSRELCPLPIADNVKTSYLTLLSPRCPERILRFIEYERLSSAIAWEVHFFQ